MTRRMERTVVLWLAACTLWCACAGAVDLPLSNTGPIANALRDLQAMNTDNDPVFNFWFKDTQPDPCDENWPGITCNTPDDWEIDLHGVSLPATLPESISALAPVLTKLDVRFSGVRGPLPASLFQLHKLRTLRLAHNTLGDSLSASWDSLTALEELDCDTCGLTGALAGGWDPSKLTALRVLKLDNNGLTGALTAVAFPTSLHELVLARNSLTGNAHALNALVNIEVIDLHGNEIGPDFPQWPAMDPVNIDLEDNAISGELHAASLTAWSRVERFDIEDNAITGTLPTVSWAGCTRFDVASNRLSGIVDAAQMLADSHALQYLELQDNELTGPPPHVAADAPLLWYRASHNEFTGTLPPTLGTPGSVEEVLLAYNHIGGSVPAVWAQSTAARKLQLHGNNLDGTLASTFFDGWEHLHTLSLHSNELSGALPPLTGNHTTLRTVDVHGNAFTGDVPDSWAQLPGVTELDISYCALDGTLPAVWDMPALQSLSARHNELRGALPDLSALVALHTVDLRENALSGALPASWTTLGLVRVLLSSNDLSGTLPPAWLRMPALNWLVAEKNAFTGTIPGERITAPITILDLNENQLEGTIPPALGVASLESIDVSDNMLSGTLPEALFTGPDRLALLAVGNNAALTGTVPAAFSTLSNLQYVDLANTTLFGVLPEPAPGASLRYGAYVEGSLFYCPIPDAWLAHDVSTACCTPETGECGSNGCGDSLGECAADLLCVSRRCVEPDAASSAQASVLATGAALVVSVGLAMLW